MQSSCRGLSLSIDFHGLSAEQTVQNFHRGAGSAVGSSSEEDWFEPEDIEVQTLYVGQAFEGGIDALYAVQDYALRQGKSVRMGRSSDMDSRIVCSSECCSFFIQVYIRRLASKMYGKWCVSSMDTDHINCVSVARLTKR